MIVQKENHALKSADHVRENAPNHVKMDFKTRDIITNEKYFKLILLKLLNEYIDDYQSQNL